jgi:hypothetical protein
MNCWRLGRSGPTWEIKTPGDPVIGGFPHFCEFYLQEFNQVLTVNIREKSLHPSSKGRRVKYARALNTSHLNKIKGNQLPRL